MLCEAHRGCGGAPLQFLQQGPRTSVGPRGWRLTPRGAPCHRRADAQDRACQPRGRRKGRAHRGRRTPHAAPGDDCRMPSPPPSPSGAGITLTPRCPALLQLLRKTPSWFRPSLPGALQAAQAPAAFSVANLRSMAFRVGVRRLAARSGGLSGRAVEGPGRAQLGIAIPRERIQEPDPTVPSSLPAPPPPSAPAAFRPPPRQSSIAHARARAVA